MAPQADEIWMQLARGPTSTVRTLLRPGAEHPSVRTRPPRSTPEHTHTTGYPDGTFHPAAPITRQGFVTQLTRLLVMPT